MYSVSAASRMSGVPPATLRAWERRYEVIQPRRDERGRRVYAPEDVERLRLLRRATELGHAISRLACLSAEELGRVCQACPAEAAREPDGQLGHLVARLLNAVERYRGDECDEALGLAAMMLEPEVLVREVVGPAMQAVGERWHRGELTTAQERLLSGSVRRTLGSLVATYRRRAHGPVLVLATLPGEYHDIGLMVTALTAASEGLDCVYLGPDIPPRDMVAAAKATAARCVGLSCVTRSADRDLLAAITDLRARLPEGCELWLGGCSTRCLDAEALPQGCVRLGDDGDLRRRARALCAG